jgi:hypothetical protein
MCVGTIPTPDLIDKHLGMFHQLTLNDALNTWTKLAIMYGSDLEYKGIGAQEINSLFEKTYPRYDGQKYHLSRFWQQNKYLAVSFVMVDSGLIKHRETKRERWTGEKATAHQMPPPSNYHPSSTRNWTRYNDDPTVYYIIDTILDDLFSWDLEDSFQHMGALLADWAHTLPYDHEHAKSLDAIHEHEAVSFAIGKSWEAADLLEKRMQYQVDAGDLRAIAETINDIEL